MANANDLDRCRSGTARPVGDLSVGDGGIAMLLGELLTLVQNGIAGNRVFNNSSLNFVRISG